MSDLQNYAVGISHHAHRPGNLGEQSSDISIRKFQLYSSSIHFAAKKFWFDYVQWNAKTRAHAALKKSPEVKNIAEHTQ